MSERVLVKWNKYESMNDGTTWVRYYDGGVIRASEVMRLLSDEVLTALLLEKRRQRADRGGV